MGKFRPPAKHYSFSKPTSSETVTESEGSRFVTNTLYPKPYIHQTRDSTQTVANNLTVRLIAGGTYSTDSLETSVPSHVSSNFEWKEFDYQVLSHNFPGVLSTTAGEEVFYLPTLLY